MSDLTNAREALKHRWSEPRVTGYGFAWACPDCDSVVQGMPPDRDALCKGRMLAEIERLGSAHDTLRAQLTAHELAIHNREAEAMAANVRAGELAEQVEGLRAQLTTADAIIARLTGEAGEMAATLENEVGQGEPPSEGWTPSGPHAPGFGWSHDEARASFVTGRTYHGVAFKHWQWHLYEDDARGEAPTARAAMRLADAALSTARSPK